MYTDWLAVDYQERPEVYRGRSQVAAREMVSVCGRAYDGSTLYKIETYDQTEYALDRNGECLHREIGPAVIKRTGDHKYYFRGVEYSKAEWLTLVNNHTKE